ncbi:uncharacterized protein LAESUDRAFT_393456 [Laetiporus sulphureus 93-53]|uniref:PB1 domain-containing protein n=1 Tax=Laetiporus sulphureus 93-53 TaxID=1314785 RepID=A0A165CIB2_9APHY|nr:uncharacterized protein LAESUDRAFT_393456 [Laetiporus sulphureus 93-53]KZT02864.1 hypothetical protein LAESUDRAFT_393456 [Laetiporus sulphureus 93-53]
MSSNNNLQVKLTRPPSGPIRRIVFTELPSWAELSARIESLYDIPRADIAVSYVDNEDDEITLNSEEELQDLYRTLPAPDENKERLIRFNVHELRRGDKESEDGDVDPTVALANDVATLIASITAVVISHPEIVDGMHNVMRNAVNGAQGPSPFAFGRHHGHHGRGFGMFSRGGGHHGGRGGFMNGGRGRAWAHRSPPGHRHHSASPGPHAQGSPAGSPPHSPAPRERSLPPPGEHRHGGRGGHHHFHHDARGPSPSGIDHDHRGRGRFRASSWDHLSDEFPFSHHHRGHRHFGVDKGGFGGHPHGPPRYPGMWDPEARLHGLPPHAFGHGHRSRGGWGLWGDVFGDLEKGYDSEF